MTYFNFTHEEIAVMSCYNTSSLVNLIGTMQLALPHVKDKPTAETTAECIDKLCRMTETEFPELKEQLDAPEIF